MKKRNKQAQLSSSELKLTNNLALQFDKISWHGSAGTLCYNGNHSSTLFPPSSSSSLFPPTRKNSENTAFALLFCC
jgi:hypothetical protein